MLDEPDEQYQLPDYKEFMDDLLDPEKAKEFLLHIAGAAGYILEEIPEGTDIRTLESQTAVDLARSYWGIYFLDEYPDFGEYDQ